MSNSARDARTRLMSCARRRPRCERFLRPRPIAITGFEPADILLGVLDVLRLRETGKAEMVNSYPRVVHPAGNPEALRVIEADGGFAGIGSRSS